MADEQSHYQAFLLRLWQADNGGRPVWRFSLEEPGSGLRYLFQSVAELDTFLLALMDGRPPAVGFLAHPDPPEEK